jgi:cytolysin-activating lysine-acyltransferase
MFQFGRGKSADPKTQPVPPDDLSDKHEALAIGGGNAKAVADAVQTARGRLEGLEPARLAASPNSTGGNASRGGATSAPAAQPSQKAHGMTTSSSQDSTPNGTSAGAKNDAAGGTVFTEPTPGGKNKTVATLFGEIVWLFSQSPKHKNFFVSDLEWLVMTPILLKQFRVFYAPDRPIGVALWGYVNDEVEERLMGGHARLAPPDWKSGEKLWLVDIVAPHGGYDAMIKDLKEKVFPERKMHFLGAGLRGLEMRSV